MVMSLTPLLTAIGKEKLAPAARVLRLARGSFRNSNKLLQHLYIYRTAPNVHSLCRVSVKPGLWTLDWTMDWTGLDWTGISKFVFVHLGMQLPHITSGYGHPDFLEPPCMAPALF